MTKTMLEDLIKELKRKNKILIIVIAILTSLFLGMTIFAFSSFEISIENSSDIEYDIDQDAKTEGENSSITQTNNLSNNSHDIMYITCGTVLILTLILTSGVIVYGKRKNAHTHKNKKDQKNND